MTTLNVTDEHREAWGWNIDALEFELPTFATTSLSATPDPPRGVVLRLRVVDEALAFGRRLMAEDAEVFGEVSAELRDEIRSSWPA